MIHLPRIMLAAPSSGSGKTMLTCGILQALKNRGRNPASFKCGPDYIDPMFHSKVLGTPSRNLDPYFTDRNTTRYLFARSAGSSGIFREKYKARDEYSRREEMNSQGISVEKSSGYEESDEQIDVNSPEISERTYKACGEYNGQAEGKTPGISVMEGVMGLYDGMGGITKTASSYDLACVTETPVILVVNARGMSLSVIPYLKGFLDYQEKEGQVIRGVILNRTTKMTALLLKEKIEQETGLKLVGYVPELEACRVESRHLGLVTPGEIQDLQKRIETLAEELENCIDFELLIRIAEEAVDYPKEILELPEAVRELVQKDTQEFPSLAQEQTPEEPQKFPSSARELVQKDTQEFPSLAQEQTPEEPQKFPSSAQKQRSEETPGFQTGLKNRLPERRGMHPKIAVARDEAFCFYYQDNLDLLELLGAQLVYFSPLRAETLPAGTAGILLGGGYPELYADRLSENERLLADIRRAIRDGMPYLAECGGFMYLHERMQDMEDVYYPMAGVIPGDAYRTKRLGRFGYIELQTGEEQLLPMGESIRGHEFHYFDSTTPGSDYHARKPVTGKEWDCIWGTEKTACGYPHLYYWSNPRFAARFLEQARAYAVGRTGQV